MYYSEVFDAADKVDSFETFLDFMSLLEQNFRQSGSCWENQTIDMFLEASAAWANDNNRNKNSDSNLKTASWQNFARILSSGIIYE